MTGQFKHQSGTPKKQVPSQQSEATRPGGKQAPANQTPAGPSAQRSSSTPIQSPHSLPGIPMLPGLQKNAKPTKPLTPPDLNAPKPIGNPPFQGPPSHVPNAPKPISNPPFQGPPSYIPHAPKPISNPPLQGPPSHVPHAPKPIGNFVPPGTPSSINPAGNFPGPINNSRPMAAGQPPFGSPQGNSFPGTGHQMGAMSLSNTGKPIPPSGSPAFYSGGSFPGGSTQGPPNRPQGSVQRAASWLPSGPKSPKKKDKKRLPTWGRVAIGVLVFLLIIAGGSFAYYQIAIAPTLNNILGKQAIHHTGQTDTQNDTGTAPTGRTNIMLLGSDTDGKGNDANNGTPLAQTVLIITVDPTTNYVGMLSIPRDMQVTEKGYAAPKLDEVFSHGYTGNSLQDKVASGAGAMEDIIQYNFGIHIDHYAWVGLDGFVKVIDTAGGIDVDGIHPMVDDTYPDDVGNTNGSIYDYKRLDIAPGPQHFNGIQGLEYVRTRHSDLVGDFGRTIRQQQMITQLKSKLATPDTLGKASELLQDLNGAVQTDMQSSDIIGMGDLARNVDSNKVDHLTLGPPDYATPSGANSNYLPICANIVPKIQKMFNVSLPRCVPQGTSNSSSIAHTPEPATTVAATPLNAATTPKPDQGPISSGTAKNSATTNTAGDFIDAGAGVHGLLDILFTTTIGSFDAMRI